MNIAPGTRVYVTEGRYFGQSGEVVSHIRSTSDVMLDDGRLVLLLNGEIKITSQGGKVDCFL